jgi:hypothetical protein
VLDFVRGVHEGELSREAIIQGGQGYGLGRPSADLNPSAALAPAPS